MTDSKKVNAAAWSPVALKAIDNAANATASGLLNNADVKELLKNAAFKGKTLPSLRGKVVAMKLYQAGVSTKPDSAEGEKITRKLDFVRAIETLLSVPVDTFATFEKASKLQLEKLSDALVALSDKKDADQQ